MVHGRILRLLLAVLVCSAPAASSAGASVLYVGDSLGVGTGPQLESRLGGTALELDAKIGRPSGAGVEILGSLIAPDHDVVVFDLGTNDDPAATDALAANLAAARRLAGGRCLVVATLNRPPLNGVSINGLNRVVARFAARDPNVSLVDWHAAAAARPGLLIDGVHANSEGYALRAGLFADAIAACSAFGGDPGGSSQLEPEPGSLPPPASAGRNTGERAGEPARDRPASAGPGARVEALARALAPAVATGTDFG
jgi:lysophospholipase L1-like esterase